MSCIYVWYRALLSYAEALQHMQHSSAAAVACLREAGATGCSDVTGFGLIGNLAEMTRASQVLSRGQERLKSLRMLCASSCRRSEVSSAQKPEQLPHATALELKSMVSMLSSTVTWWLQ